MARPVVAGNDGSQESRQAVGWAAAEAARHSAPLRIVTVAAPSCPADGEDPAAMLDELMQAVYAQSLRTAAADLARTAPGLIVETELLDGPAGWTLAHDSSTAQLLVVGAYGVGGYRQPGLGRAAGYLATHAHCPVVVARHPGGTVHDEIVVGVRDMDDGAGAIPFAFEEAALRGARLRVVHAWFPLDRWFGAEAENSAEAAARLAEGVDEWRGKYPEVEVSCTGVEGLPGRVLADFSGRADLTVIGRHDRADGGPGAGKFVLHKVLSQATGPVAVVPSR
jgi:nucleotide-binding universal stress UspA family protein